MIRSNSILGCFDVNGVLNDEKVASYVKRRSDSSDDDDDSDNDDVPVQDSEPKKKRPYMNRNFDGYDPSDATSSEWYRRYVTESKSVQDKKHFEKFRRRFRMPHHCFLLIVQEARENSWFS